jgi:predicted short-subunit dehydrogenase-like oxidoreductase (DUF2520 family)
MKIVLIGAGNVAFHLGILIRRSGHDVIQVYNRSRKSGQQLAEYLNCKYTGSVAAIDQHADMYIVALKDDVISDFCSRLSFVPKLIVHTSGTCSMEVFPENFDCGVLYPVQTFSKTIDTPRLIPFCIEARKRTSLKVIKNLAGMLSDGIYPMSSSEREKVHLAAVIVNNFTNHLFTLSEEYLRSEKMSFDILRPLILETALKVQKHSPSKMQTGPAKRGDKAVIGEHRKLLKHHMELKSIYDILTKSILNNPKRT